MRPPTISTIRFRATEEALNDVRQLAENFPNSPYAPYASLRLGQYKLHKYQVTKEPNHVLLFTARRYLQHAVDFVENQSVENLAKKELLQARLRTKPEEVSGRIP